MRPKVIAFTMLAAILLIAVAVLPSRWSRTPPPDTSTSSNAPAEAAGVPAPAVHTPAPVAAPTTRTAAAKPPAADPERTRRLRQRVAELNALAMNNDVASRDAILAELQNSEKVIRQAALEAAIQFGDRSVVPRIQEIAAQTEDPEEKADLLAAVDYINLPSLTEYLAEQRARNPLGQTNAHHSSTNRVAGHSHTLRTNATAAP